MRLRRMRGFERLTKVDDAQRIIRDNCPNYDGVDTVSIDEAWGRLLEQDVVSPVDVPPFDRSAVDGYAIASKESFSASRSNPAIVRVIGVSEAGQSRQRIGPGECIEIYTGAPVPKGSDAVVMAEDCGREGGRVMVFRAVPKLANISKRGEDIGRGSCVLVKGETLRPWHIGILASIGIGGVTVRKLPLVGVFSTGSELVDLGRMAIPEGKIIDSTRPMVLGLLRELGCNVIDGGIVEDNLRKISDQIASLTRDADAVISIGGTSVGGKDLVPEAMEILEGTKIKFHGLAVKPGKPAGFGIVGKRPFFMLPGYPVSALVGFELLIVPLLCRWLGRKPPKRRTVGAFLTRRVPTSPGIRHFLRVTLECRNGTYYATPIAITGSGLLSSITRADGLVVIGEELEGLEKGEQVNVELLRGWL